MQILFSVNSLSDEYLTPESCLQPNTEISQATTRIATINDKDVEQEVDEEVIDEWEQLRRRKAEKVRREAENMANIRMRIKMCAPRVLPLADADSLIFEMHWGFPPRAPTRSVRN